MDTLLVGWLGWECLSEKVTMTKVSTVHQIYAPLCSYMELELTSISLGRVNVSQPSLGIQLWPCDQLLPMGWEQNWWVPVLNLGFQKWVCLLHTSSFSAGGVQVTARPQDGRAWIPVSPCGKEPHEWETHFCCVWAIAPSGDFLFQPFSWAEAYHDVQTETCRHVMSWIMASQAEEMDWAWHIRGIEWTPVWSEWMAQDLKHTGRASVRSAEFRGGHCGLNQTWNNELVPNWERSVSRLYIVTLLI